MNFAQKNSVKEAVMAWNDGREDLDRLIQHNKTCHPDEVIYVWKEWSSSDGITWGNMDDEGNSITYNPNGEDCRR